MNEYYVSPADLLPVTKARSVDINQLDTSVDAAFDKLPTEEKLKKGTVNYAVDTGAVNAIAASVYPATITALTDGLQVRVKVAFANTGATPTLNLNGLGAVAIARADGTAIQPADIPANICTFSYNATTTKWVFTPPGARGLKGDKGDPGLNGIGSDAAALAGNQVMTVASPGALRFTPTAPGQSVTLPNATTIVEHAFLYSLENASPYDYWIKDFAGTLLGVIHPGEVVRVANIDNATPAGSWSLDGADFVGVEADITVTTASATTAGANGMTLFEALPLDANRTLLIFGGIASVHAAVHDASTGITGAPVLIRTGNFMGTNGRVAACLAAAANTALVITGTSSFTSYLQAFVLTIAGTTITVGAPVNSNAIATGSYILPECVALVGTSYIVTSRTDTSGTGGGYVSAITIAGTTPTWGNFVGGWSNAQPGSYIWPVSANTFAVATLNINGADGLRVYGYSVAGTVLTYGAYLGLATNTLTGIIAKPLSSGRLALAYQTSSPLVAVSIVSMAGNVPSIATVTMSGNLGACVAVGNTMRLVNLNGGIPSIHVVTDNAGTPVLGSTLTFQAATGGVLPMPLGAFGTEAWFETPSYDANQMNSYILKVGASGGNPTLSYTMSAIPPAGGLSSGYFGAVQTAAASLDSDPNSVNMMMTAARAFLPHPHYSKVYDAQGIKKHERLSYMHAPTYTQVAAAGQQGVMWAAQTYGSTLTVKLQKLRLV